MRVNLIKEELLKGDKFTLQRPKGPSVEIVFRGKEILEGAEEVVDGWRISDGNYNELKLYKGPEVQTILILQPTGEWRGRHRRHGGHCILSPTPATIAKWVEIQEKPSTDMSWQEQLKHWSPKTSGFSAMISEVLPAWDNLNYKRLLKNRKTAVILIGCDRVDYFKRVLQALAEQVQDIPVFVFLDHKDKFLQNLHITAARNEIPHAVIHRRCCNWGCGRNIIDARRIVFDNFGFEQAFIFEDDFIPSSNYIQLMLRLMEWAKANYVNVGAVQGWNPCLHSKGEKSRRLSVVEATLCNWWGYLLRKEAWDAIKEKLYTMMDQFLMCDYKERPHLIIKAWMKEWREAGIKVIEGKQFPTHIDYAASKKEHWENAAAGQDGVTANAFLQAGYVKIAPQVNRGVYIGQKGIHMTPTRFSEAGFSSMILDDFVEDKVLDVFEVAKSRWQAPSKMDGFVTMRR